MFRAVKRYAKGVKADNKAKILTKIEAGDRFSVTTDEYTSTQNKRFSCVSLHPPSGRPIKIGMMRIHGSLPAEKAAADLRGKINEYGLKEDHHIVANTTDGAAVMVAMGREFRAIHQLCFSHGIHLAGKPLLARFFSKKSFSLF